MKQWGTHGFQYPWSSHNWDLGKLHRLGKCCPNLLQRSQELLSREEPGLKRNDRTLHKHGRNRSEKVIPLAIGSSCFFFFFFFRCGPQYCKLTAQNSLLSQQVCTEQDKRPPVQGMCHDVCILMLCGASAERMATAAVSRIYLAMCIWENSSYIYIEEMTSWPKHDINDNISNFN